jgi:hypothetical protein
MFETVCSRDSIRIRSPPVPSVRLYILFHTSMYNSLPEDEPADSKHV